MPYKCPVPGCGGELTKSDRRAITNHENTDRHAHAAEAYALYTRMLKGDVPPMDGARKQSIGLGR